MSNERIIDIERDAEVSETRTPQHLVRRTHQDADAIAPANPFSNAYAINVLHLAPVSSRVGYV